MVLTVSSPSYADDSAEAPSIVWKPGWRRVGWWEVGLSAGMLTSSYAINSLLPSNNDASWKGPVLFDEGARDAFRMRSKQGRNTAAAISDGLVVGASLYPFADATFAAWVGHGSGDVAWQLAVIDVEAMSTSTFLAAIAKRAFGRERPYGTACDADSSYRDGCDSVDRYRSYFSGHSAFTATAAGLTCAHHAWLPLYGGGAADGAACGFAVTLTTTTGVLRIASDNHWASDVLTGHVVGFSTGLLIPWLLYYRDDVSSEKPDAAWFVMPSVAEGSLGAAATGWF